MLSRKVRMLLTIPGPSDGHYIIRSKDAGQLAEFIDEVSKDPAMELLDSIGPVGQPHTIVVAMPREKAVFLEQRFRISSQLTIEPDRPLSLFDGA